MAPCGGLRLLLIQVEDCRASPLFRALNARGFKIKVQLYEEGFSERVSAAKCLHSLEQELERGVHLLVFGARFEVLDEDAGGDVDAEGYEGVHLYVSC